jgi:Cu2+-exporting ATPase
MPTSLQPGSAAASDANPAAPIPTPAGSPPAGPLAVDDPIEWASFGREAVEAGAKTWESFIAVDNMVCAACAISVEGALLSVRGVQSASVNATAGKARVVWHADETKPSTWLNAVKKAGYPARPLADAGSEQARRQQTRKALWRWLVAGLCMMQVMMYAYPLYVATDLELGADAKALLRWASWLLTLPVILFSSGPFFSKAMHELRRGIVGMDLPVAVGIAITFLVSTAGTFNPAGPFGQEVYFDSLTMFVFFLLSGRLLELRLRDRVFLAVDSALHKMPETVSRINYDGSLESISAKRLRVGDLLLVPPGQTFSADGVVTLGHSLVNEAVLTGESEPLVRTVGDQVIAASVNLTAPLTLTVQRVGSKTRVGEIIALMAQAQTSRPASASIADTIAKPFLIGVLLLAVLTAAYWWSTDPQRGLMAAVAVLIVTCPCALSLATPVAMLASVGAMAKNNILVKRLAALETLAKVDVVVFDKTGTLTADAMALINVSVRQGVRAHTALAMAAGLAEHSLHPLSKALVAAADAKAGTAVGLPLPKMNFAAGSIRETPGAGIEGCRAATDLDLPVEIPYGAIKLGSADFCGVDVPQSGAAVVHLADSEGWLATFDFAQQLRDDALQTVQALKRAGIASIIMSGDGWLSTQSIALQLGIERAYGAMQPTDKLAALRALHEKGHVVAVVGDGINDALVLAAADVSVSLGSAVPMAQNQCDILLQKACLIDVPRTRLQAIQTLRIVRQNLAWALVYNVVMVPLAALGWLPAWLAGLGMALSSLLVIANAMRLGPLYSQTKAA